MLEATGLAELGVARRERVVRRRGSGGGSRKGKCILELRGLLVRGEVEDEGLGNGTLGLILTLKGILLGNSS